MLSCRHVLPYHGAGGGSALGNDVGSASLRIMRA
jgi:hypothetical protein